MEEPRLAQHASAIACPASGGHKLVLEPTGCSHGKPTLDAAVQVSTNACFEILSFFGASAHQVGYLSERRSYPLCFTAWSYVSGSVGLGKGGCDYVTTHNFTDRCRAKREASLVTQIIRLTYLWVTHSNCDISPSS
ncbi:hypothetical protein PoB_001358100 [Plakobranchus ocellatus]|uniref:Uncharacterized protein n=1 Tax=Plakobranchus ocellatus TaxID=259542 RepID=A0AAV3YUH1_9GAST|nr:hypothetical protein PoB_001358100 [Plakobranchus ocellatus]